MIIGTVDFMSEEDGRQDAGVLGAIGDVPVGEVLNGGWSKENDGVAGEKFN